MILIERITILWNEIITAVNNSGSFFAGIAAVAAVVTGFILKRRSTDANLTVDERRQLSLDETEFRKSILIQLKECQKAHQAASDERETFRKLNFALERRISELEAKCYSCLFRASQENVSG